MKESKVISLRIDPDHLEKLRKMARTISAKKDKDVSYADIIRELIEKKLEKTK